MAAGCSRQFLTELTAGPMRQPRLILLKKVLIFPVFPLELREGRKLGEIVIDFQLNGLPIQFQALNRNIRENDFRLSVGPVVGFCTQTQFPGAENYRPVFGGNFLNTRGHGRDVVAVLQFFTFAFGESRAPLESVLIRAGVIPAPGRLGPMMAAHNRKRRARRSFDYRKKRLAVNANDARAKGRRVAMEDKAPVMWVVGHKAVIISDSG